MSELLPCPFCGSEAHTIEPARYGKSWGVRCECGAFLGFEYTEAEAIATWNSRAERTCRMKPVYASNALECSECSSYVATWDAECDVCSINYCPNCGAKVVGE